MQTLTYGLKQPEDGDKGSIFFPALEDNIIQLDAHYHDGIDSSLIPTASLVYSTSSILSAAWVAVAGHTGLYSQTVTMPTGLTYDNRVITFKDASTGHVYLLTIEKVSANSYEVYINDNSIDLTAIYV